MKHSLIGVAILTMLTSSSPLAAQKPKGGQPKPQHVSRPVAKNTVKPAKVKTSFKTTTKSRGPVVKTKAPIGTLSPVQQKLQRNTNLSTRLRGRLPAGTDLMTASSGFRNLGQFVSTVNASYNHNLSFEGLKQRIVYDGMSLGQAMKDMR